MAQVSQQTMKKSVDMKSRLEEAMLGGANARSEMMRRRQSANLGGNGDRTPPAGGAGGGTMSYLEGSKLRWRKDQVQWRPTHEQFERFVLKLVAINVQREDILVTTSEKLKPAICENKCTNYLCSDCTADQCLCFRYIGSTIP